MAAAIGMGRMASAHKRVVISGYYGFGNAGDEAILSGMLLQLRAECPGAEFCVVSGSPDLTRAEHGTEAVHWQEPLRIFEAIKSADLVIIGGGGLFQDYWGVDLDVLLTPAHWGMSYQVAPALMAYLAGTPLMVYALGVGPLTSEHGRRLARAAFDAASVITLRDAASAAIAASLGVPGDRLRVSADPAFALRFPNEPDATDAAASLGRGPRIVAAFRNWEIGVSARFWERQVAAALDAVVEEEGATVTLLPFQRLSGRVEDDRTVAERIAGLMRRSEAVSIAGGPDTLDEIWRQIRRADLVVGMRLHALVFSALAAVPFVALAYDPKVASLMEEMGLGEYAIDIGSVETAMLADRMRKALAQSDTIRTAAARSVARLRDAALEDARLAARLLRGEIVATPRLDPSVVQLMARGFMAQARDNALLRQRVTQADRSANEADDRAAGTARARDEAMQVQAALQNELSNVRNERERLFQEVERRKMVERDLRDERAALEAQLSAVTHHRDELVGATETLNAALASTRAEVSSLDTQLRAALTDLFKIHRSRLWRIGSGYWRLLERLGRLRGGTTPTRVELTASPVATAAFATAAAEPPRPDAPRAVAPAQPAPAAIPTMPGEDVLPGVPAGAYDVVVFSIIDFDFRFQRPQQLATQFARHGHRVFYISIARVVGAEGPPWEVAPLAPNLVELRLRTRPLDIYGGSLEESDLQNLEHDVSDLIARLALGDTLCLVQIPFWWPLAKRLRERFGWRVAYDCMDEWNNFPGFRDAVLDLEDGLVREADVTVVSADRLVEKHRARAGRLVLAKNGVDLTHYRQRFEENTLLADVKHPIIGYFGALASWVDVPLIEKVADAYPEATVVLAGGQFDVDLSPLTRRSNVRLLGQLPYEQMPRLLWHFDACMIPFQVNEITEATNPVKFYEYLYGGKPVVAPMLTELVPYRELCYLAEGHDEFVACLGRALGESADDPKRDRRRAVAEENDWGARYGTINAAVREGFPLVSVVVVTYAGLELTRACLQSLLERETWPALEVIVVDNASTDGTPEYLEKAARGNDRLRVILNDSNRGFAAANNQGLQQARGDVLVLLNNDTVVPPGLIGRMVHHLRRDRTVGLLCPTTNFCGNEAKVDPDYSEIEDMPAYAARRAASFPGTLLELETAAMYCVAMRRDVLEAVGPLDETFGVGLFEDDDYSRRVARAGFRIVCAEDAYVHHVGQASFAKLSRSEYDRIWKANQAYFEQKWGETWKPHRPRTGVRAAQSKTV